MSPFKMVLAACGPIGAILCVLFVLLCSIAPGFMNEHEELKKWILIIGVGLALIGFISILVLAER